MTIADYLPRTAIEEVLCNHLTITEVEIRHTDMQPEDIQSLLLEIELEFDREEI